MSRILVVDEFGVPWNSQLGLILLWLGHFVDVCWYGLLVVIMINFEILDKRVFCRKEVLRSNLVLCLELGFYPGAN